MGSVPAAWIVLMPIFEVDSPVDSMFLEGWRKAQALSSVPIKITIPGPMTICNTISVDGSIETGIYKDRQAICEDLVLILKQEIAFLVAAASATSLPNILFVLTDVRPPG